MSGHKRSIWIMMLILFLSTLACTISIGGPDYPTGQSIPVSTEAAASLAQTISSAVAAGTSSGAITFVMSETQVTSYLYYRLQEQSEPFITNPQVYLRDGQVQIYGTAKSGYFTANVRIVFTAAPDENGQLAIELVEADFGPLPAPEGLKETVTAIVSEAYTGSLGPIATGFRIESITVDNGIMTLTGRIK